MITVGIDGSDNALRALEWALDEAMSRNCALRVLAVGDGPETAAVLDETFASVAEDRDISVPVSLEVVANPPAAALVGVSARSDLLVLGRRGVGGFLRLLAGSTVDACTQHARCPVVVVPNDYRVSTGRVLVAVDDSDEAADALRWAMREAARRPLVVVMAYAGLPLREGEREPSVAAAAILADLVDKVDNDVDQPHLDVEQLALKGELAHVLLDLARADDLIVIGCRGRSPLPGTLLGSASRVLTEHAPCPVVVVRDDRH